MNTLSILSHISVFLSGVFLALLIASSHITNSHDVSNHHGGGAVHSALKQSVVAGTRGGERSTKSSSGVSSDNDLRASLEEERRNTKELEDKISQLQSQRRTSGDGRPSARAAAALASRCIGCCRCSNGCCCRRPGPP